MGTALYFAPALQRPYRLNCLIVLDLFFFLAQLNKLIARRAAARASIYDLREEFGTPLFLLTSATYGMVRRPALVGNKTNSMPR
jgi:hypothetical protein